MIIIISIFVILLSVLGVLGGCGYLAYCMIHAQSEAITQTPTDYGLYYEDITFEGMKDKIHLSGWWIPAQSKSRFISSNHTIILSHGYHNARSLEGIQLLDLVRVLVRSRYNVMMYDLRNCGYSQKTVITGGYLEKYDLLGAIEYVKKNKQSSHIALMGWSMGAAISLFAGILSEDVEVIIADSPFSDLEECLNVTMPVYTKLPRFPFTVVTLRIVSRLLKIDMKELRPIEAIRSLKDKPLLLIHAKEDEIIPSEETKAIYEAIPHKGKVELWIPNIKGHILGHKLQKKEYQRRVLYFLKKYFR
ncbi:alpha/beta hydrolase [Sporanaerobium hydrogeniformans]|uniref:alpha/beta hydrolase n=1 Tax=Sporanaerobium hydrogeniformans TaxID=3072179 RepID=UPI0015D51B91|nr:alpha/beta hydrolase [Sporanaerobium hydrogeniformans]